MEPKYPFYPLPPLSGCGVYDTVISAFGSRPEYPLVKPTPKSMLKPGYVCVTRNGHHLMVIGTKNGMIVCGDDTGPLSVWESDLMFSSSGKDNLDIMKVYGFSNYPGHSYSCSSDGRDLIWERKEVKKMTVKEICDALGYEVEIVKEGEK